MSTPGVGSGKGSGPLRPSTACERRIASLGSGRQFDCDFTYKVQDQAGGIAEALGLGREFARGERLVVILGDNIFQDGIGLYVERFAQQLGDVGGGWRR